jgi:two-component system NarL family response regulator
MEPVRVLLADDHALFREGLVQIIGAQPDFEVVGEAGDGLEAFVKAQQLKPGLILMDVRMPGMDGLEATRQIKQVLPETVIVMLTVRGDDERLFTALKNGAQGYLLKDIRSQEMLTMLRGALHGEAALSPSLAARVIDEFRRLTAHGTPDREDDCGLTERELQVLTEVARGATDKEVAQALMISLNTVKTHMRNILSKLQVTTRREAARLAKSRGIV